MDTTLKIALVGALGAVIGSLLTVVIGPHVMWGIKKKELLLAHRRELVAKWRKMLFEISQRQVKTAEPIVHMLELYEDFYSLKPHLREGVIDRLGLTDNLRGKSFENILKAEALISDVVNENRPLKNSGAFRLITDEVARIEREWRLV